MSFDPETGEEIEQETPLIQRLRQQLEDQGKQLKESAEARRELAFLRAGVDTEAKAGKLLLKSYDGDLSDIEALRTEAQELGVYREAGAPSTATSTAASDATSSGGSVSLETGSVQRQAVANDATGATPNAKQDPRAEAKAAYDDAIKNRHSDEDAQAEYFSVLARRTAIDTGQIAG